MSNMYQSMLETWSTGLNAWQEAVLGGPESPNNVWSDCAERVRHDAYSSQAADLYPALLQAGMVSTASSLRYWNALLSLMLRYDANVLQILSSHFTDNTGTTHQVDRVVADQLRALLREIGDTASKESRILQRDLEKVSELIAQITDQHSTNTCHDNQNVRRHEAKL